MLKTLSRGTVEDSLQSQVEDSFQGAKLKTLSKAGLTTPLKLSGIKQAFADRAPITYDITPDTRQAAVAMVLRPGSLESLFILRAKRDGDPWSGHMAFPGGHVETIDASLQATAERETREEIGVDLSACARCLGPMDQVRANPRSGRDMVVSPYLFVLEEEPAYALNYEVADVLWGSVDDMFTGASLTREAFPGYSDTWAGYSVGGQLVWGLTFRILDLFFAAIDPDWVHRPS
jgi:8-oxo-dGTP pyrophosphatase MutT (NUDIX family)